MFESKHSATRQIGQGFSTNVPDGCQPILAGSEGFGGFETGVSTL